MNPSNKKSHGHLKIAQQSRKFAEPVYRSSQSRLEKLSTFTVRRTGNSIRRRCREDEATRLRLKYNPYYHTIEGQNGSHVHVNGQELIMLSSNDYLGLSHHPKVIEAGKRALETWGSSTTGARLANGSRRYHLALEEMLADFLGKEACHVSAAGYLSCMSGVATFACKGDLILVDRNAHSSLWSGICVSGARVERFSHNNPADLQDILSLEPPQGPKLLVIEGVYSMEGHIAQIPAFLKITKGKNCFIVMDDAHGLGVLGREGRGTADHLGVTGSIDVIAGSMSKALSSTGGFVAGSKEVIDYLRTNSKQTVFSAAISPCQAACAQASLEILQTEPEHLQRLWENTRQYIKILNGLGLDTWGSESPAVPIVLGSKALTFRFWKSLMEKGVFTVMAVTPGVAPGKDLIRTSISARHSQEDLEKIGEAMAQVVKELF